MIDFSDFKECESVFRFFEEITAIPRGSGNPRPIADYLVDFAKERGLEYYRDGADNVVIKKAATPAMTGRPTVILQGHTDIVAEKLAGCPIDMSAEGPHIVRDGDFLRADGTTLGGDDGVAVAYALALLDSSDIEHPDIEAVFTSDEETGLIGATALDASVLRGRVMINIDSDAEGIFTVSCAGGVRVDIDLPVERVDDELGLTVYKLSVSGLTGGHSGIEIDKKRTNAIKLIADVLSLCDKDVYLDSLKGGNADNAIPREAEAVFFTYDIALVREKLAFLLEQIREREPDVRLNLGYASVDYPLTPESSRAVLYMISAMPNGVRGMSRNIEGLVETSMNIGIVELGYTKLSLSLSIRSSVDGEKAALEQRVRNVAEAYGASASARGAYPAWEYRRDSHLRNVMCEVYEKMYGKAPKVMAIHAGLECGIFAGKLEGLDCVSIGPDNFDIHTPDEHLSIPSTARVWEFLKEVLKNI